MAISMSGCSGASDKPAANEPTGPYAATASPDPGMSPIAPPADFSAVAGEGFTISAPGEFQQQRRTSNNGEPMLVLEHPSKVAAIPERVAVIRDVDPVSDAEEQSYALEVAKSAASGTKRQSDGPTTSADNAPVEVKRVALKAPEGESAFLITWQEKVAAPNKTMIDVTYWQLMHQVSSELIFNVVALAPSEDFDSSEVTKILRTFRPSAESVAS